MCVKMWLQCGDLVSDVVTPLIYFYEQNRNQDNTAAETGTTFLQLTVGFLPEESCLLAVPSNATLRNATETLVGNLAVPPAGDITANMFAESDPAYQLPGWFDVLYLVHAFVALLISVHVIRSAMPYLRHSFKPFWGKKKVPESSRRGALSTLSPSDRRRVEKSTRVLAIRTDDEEDGGTKDGVLTEVIETEGLKLVYLKASKRMFWAEDATGIVLSGTRFVHRCRLTGLTLRNADQVLMLTQFLLSFIMFGCECVVLNFHRRRAVDVMCTWVPF